MAPVKPRNYEFNAASISGLRTRLKMKQAKMAELLGVPANTLSRWETGATKPDAESLAAIYSVATENGVAIDFFKRSTNAKSATKKGGNSVPKSASLPVAKSVVRAGIFLDFQNVGVSDKDFPAFNKILRKRLSDCFPNLKKSRFRAFVGSGQKLSVFHSNQWSASSGSGNRDKDIAKAMKNYCQSNTKGTALVLLTKDGDFASPIKELKSKGVLVYLVSSPNPSKKLIDAVGNQNWLNLSTFGQK